MRIRSVPSGMVVEGRAEEGTEEGDAKRRGVSDRSWYENMRLLTSSLLGQVDGAFAAILLLLEELPKAGEELSILRSAHGGAFVCRRVTHVIDFKPCLPHLVK